ncbi:MAG: aspartyl/asparaginyl beta-hydroxylase domain-containing protein [Bryobacterales bacterium]|nr:aspartyl/asparaginyl beta-hydroxylase domain-containing protein [Bryobacterales bacterium]
MRTAVRLPISVDVAALQRDLDTAARHQWITHFNSGYFDGDWSGIVLRGREGEIGIVPGQTSSADGFRDAPVLEACPAFRSVLEQIDCELLSVRLLRLTPGSVIREHSDWDLSTEHETVRLHVAVRTNPQVEFYVNGERVVLNEGESWYLDLSKPHRVQNLGATDRVHLVIDCVANAWLRALIAANTQRPHEDARQANPFAEFQQDVWRHPHLLAELLTVDTEHFAESVVMIARRHGHHITAEDVTAAQRQTRREWTERYRV